MRLIDRLRPTQPAIERQSLEDFITQFSFQNAIYGASGLSGSGNGETIPNNFTAYVTQAYQKSGVVGACISARMLLFSQARFQWRRRSTSEVFGDTALAALERPGPSRTTGELLAAMEVDVSLAGNAYVARRARRGQTPVLRRLRPDWVTIVIDSPNDDPNHLDSEVVGYLYQAGGSGGAKPETLDVSEVAHFSPMPDPLAQHRGMSWLTPVLDEILSHSSFTTHKRTFADNAAVIPYAVMYPEMEEEEFKKLIRAFRRQHEEGEQRGRSVHLMGGADIKPLGANLQELDFKSVQGASETMVCANARVPAVVAGVSEGLSGSSLNAGNYSQSRRQFADGWAHPSWEMVSAALEKLVRPRPSGTELWYVTDEVPFLREDRKDAAEIQQIKAGSIRTLIDGGYTAESVVSAVEAEDYSLLVHTGKLSVQLLPDESAGDAGVPSSSNGQGDPEPATAT